MMVRLMALMALTLLPLMVLAQTYVAGIEPSFPPWASVKRGEYVGIAPDAVRAIAKQQGFDVKFKSMSFSSLIPALKAGKIDILVTGLTVTPERAKQIDFTVPWWETKLDVLVPADSDTNMITALCCGSNVGVQTGTTNYEWLKDNVVGQDVDLSIHTYDTDTTALQDLLIGRLDATFLDDDTARAFVGDNPERIRIAGQIAPHPAQVYALGIAKNDDDTLLKTLNMGVVELYESGDWAKIIHKYMPDAAVGKVPTEMPADVPSYETPIAGLGS
ncbi:ABC transporter substrate-binding protein ArtJ [Salinisphaera aquimarina]